jgi:hypothetical protein
MTLTPYLLDHPPPYTILLHRWSSHEVPYAYFEEYDMSVHGRRADIPANPAMRGSYDKICSVCRLTMKDGTTTFGWTLAASTNQVTRNCQKPSTPCKTSSATRAGHIRLITLTSHSQVVVLSQRQDLLRILGRRPAFVIIK